MAIQSPPRGSFHVGCTERLGCRRSMANTSRGEVKRGNKLRVAGDDWLFGINSRHVPHLASGSDRGLAVEVDRRPRDGEPAPEIFDLAANQIGHFHAAASDRLRQWPAGDSTDMLLELRYRGAVQRPMTGVMHSRRDFIDQKLSAAR